MKPPVQCPRCGSSHIKVAGRWNYLKWFAVNLLLTIFCIFLLVRDVAPVAVSIAMFVFLIVALVSFVSFIMHERDKATCQNCGAKFQG